MKNHRIFVLFFVIIILTGNLLFVIEDTKYNKRGFEFFGGLRLSADYTEYVDQISDLHTPSDIGTHSSFSDMQTAPDSVFDTLTEQDLGSAGTNYYDYVDQISDLHDPEDIGTQSNFALMQTGLGSGYNVISEALNQTLGAFDVLYVSSYDSTSSDWTHTGSDPYLDAQDEPTNIISTSGNNDIDSWFHFDNAGVGSLFNVNITFYCKNDDGASNDYFEVYTETGLGSGTYLDSIYPDTTYDYYTLEIGQLVLSFLNALKIYVKYKKSGGSDDVYIDYVYLDTQIVSENYELDMEYGWSSLEYSETNEVLSIHANVPLAATDPWSVDVWYDGGWVEVISSLSTGINWNNVSISSYLVSADFEIRITDFFSSDVQLDSVSVDAILINTYTPPVFDNELDLEVGWTSISNYDETYEELRINCGNQGTEALRVDVWDGTWVNVITDLAVGWNNVSILSYLDSATFEIRFVDSIKTGDSVAEEWKIDSTLIFTWTPDAVDEDPPTWDTLTESADPLELGSTETININVYDASTITTVDIEFDGSNHSMSFISGDIYRYSVWTPTSVGLKVYQIHMIDQYGNTNQTGDLNITVQDTTNPVVDNIVESADPLELSQTETIQVDVTDESSMDFVYLEFEGSNHSMSFVSGITWEYTSWTPSVIGNYPYTIWANDTSGNIASDSSGSITVQDTTIPVVNNVIESADPLELGLTETIEVDVTDESPMDFVYLEFEGSNHSMSFVSGITWEYTSWTPSAIGNYPYTIWANDTSGNIGFVSGDITVQELGVDNNSPTWDNLTEITDPLELGLNFTLEINVYDETNVSIVYFEFEGVNHTMSNISSTYSYSNWLPIKAGTHHYKIWMIDYYGNTEMIKGSVLVKNTPHVVLSTTILLSILVATLFFYMKSRVFLIILGLFLFSLVFGVISLTQMVIPFSPYLQLFFLLFQTSLFTLTTLDFKRELDISR